MLERVHVFTEKLVSTAGLLLSFSVLFFKGFIPFTFFSFQALPRLVSSPLLFLLLLSYLLSPTSSFSLSTAASTHARSLPSPSKQNRTSVITARRDGPHSNTCRPSSATPASPVETSASSTVRFPFYSIKPAQSIHPPIHPSVHPSMYLSPLVKLLECHKRSLKFILNVSRLQGRTK